MKRFIIFDYEGGLPQVTDDATIAAQRFEYDTVLVVDTLTGCYYDSTLQTWEPLNKEAANFEDLK